MGVQERAKNREQVDRSATIKNQADVIKDMWSELQQLKRILIDDYPQAWKQIQKQINK
jgi:hypothetical protein